MPEIPQPNEGSVTIAGEPVAHDWQCQLRHFLRDRLPPEDMLFARWQNRVIRENTLSCDGSSWLQTPYPELPPIQIGELQWPSGASRYARALYAVDWQTLQAIAVTAWGYTPPESLETFVPDDWGNDNYSIELVINDGVRQLLATVFALPPYRVSGFGRELWLLPLVDERYFANMVAHVATEFAPEGWEELFYELGVDLEIPVTSDPVSLAYGPVDERLWKTGCPAAKALDIGALSVGLRVVADLQAGALRALNASSSSTRRASRLLSAGTSSMLQAGGQCGAGAKPKGVHVYGVRANEKQEYSYAPIGGLGEGAKSIAVWTSWFLDYEDGVHVNAAASNAFASQIATDVTSWLNSGGQFCYAGVLDYIPSGFDDYLSVQVLETDRPEVYRFTSRVYELPAVFLPPAMLTGELNCCERHYLFTLDSDMSASGANAEIRTMDDSRQVEQLHYVVNTLGHFNHMLSEDRGVCVKVRDVYYAIDPNQGGSGVTTGHVFVLTEDLDPTVGETATADVIVSGEAGISASDEITVRNTGQKLGHVGAVGWAVKVGSQYWVVEIDQYPILATAVLDDDTHDFTASGVVTGSVANQGAISVSSYETSSPYPFSFLPYSAPTILNPYNLLGHDGDSILFTWNSTDEEFQILQILPTEKKRIQFRLTDDLSTGPGTTIGAAKFEVIQPRQYLSGEMPDPANLSDPMHLLVDGLDGDYGEAAYNYKTFGWDVVAFHRRESTGGIAMTPGGGIPARSGAGSGGDPFVWGSATCTDVSATSGEIGAGTYTVYNSVDSSIGGDEVVQWKWVGSMRFVDVEGC
ncbi:hypothetical protein [Aureliella helgolandensis]|uniref:Uncharacterized protein n=1 Tax=Aureliella helgolandensis TaxID=2527968 RepID=A0A518GCS6_9BACT|nr:hypothetical protein [Aureliella helgolandensis]QDV26357.1 hypothetical protein Q31a_47300 [Aureliella helgolandensis]